MNTDQVCPSDVLREFVDDLKSAYGTGDGDELDREGLENDWPDLLATYDHALACLETLGRSAGMASGMYWRCPDCGRTLSTADWTYADLADRGIPICGDCDRDMELNRPSDDSGVPEAPSNAWIIVDSDERSVVPCIYDDYEECVSDANSMDNSLIVGLMLPDRPTHEEDEQEQSDE